MDNFEKAFRLKLRFDSPKGALSVEDLWELPLTSNSGKANLDDIARNLHREIRKEGDTASFVNPSATKDDELQLRFDIVKHVIDVRVAENRAALDAAKRREDKELLRQIIAKKEVANLETKTVDELNEMLARM
jgi:hypothetical protein